MIGLGGDQTALGGPGALLGGGLCGREPLIGLVLRGLDGGIGLRAGVGNDGGDLCLGVGLKACTGGFEIVLGLGPSGVELRGGLGVRRRDLLVDRAARLGADARDLVLGRSDTLLCPLMRAVGGGLRLGADGLELLGGGFPFAGEIVLDGGELRADLRFRVGDARDRLLLGRGELLGGLGLECGDARGGLLLDGSDPRLRRILRRGDTSRCVGLQRREARRGSRLGRLHLLVHGGETGCGLGLDRRGLLTRRCDLRRRLGFDLRQPLLRRDLDRS